MTAATRKEFGKLWKEGKLEKAHKGLEAYYLEFKDQIDTELGLKKPKGA